MKRKEKRKIKISHGKIRHDNTSPTSHARTHAYRSAQYFGGGGCVGVGGGGGVSGGMDWLLGGGEGGGSSSIRHRYCMHGVASDSVTETNSRISIWCARARLAINPIRI